MIGWILLGIAVYLIVGLTVASLICDDPDDMATTTIFWPVVIAVLLLSGFLDGLIIVGTFIRKYIWRKEE